jgi:hypothetical protein
MISRPLLSLFFAGNLQQTPARRRADRSRLAELLGYFAVGSSPDAAQTGRTREIPRQPCLDCSRQAAAPRRMRESIP